MFETSLDFYFVARSRQSASSAAAASSSPYLMDRTKREIGKMNVRAGSEYKLVSSPIIPSTSLELLNPSHDVSELHKISRSPDFNAKKLGNGRSGHDCTYSPAPVSTDALAGLQEDILYAGMFRDKRLMLPDGK